MTMKKYKDTNGGIHERDEKYVSLLPAGCVEITQEKAYEILNPPPTPEEELANVRAAREAEMPPLGDVLDAICKYIETGDRAEFDLMQANRNDVKLAHPKP